MKVPRMNRRGLCIQISLAVLFGCLANITHGYNRTLVAPWGGIDVYSPGYEYNLPYAPNTTYDYLLETSFPDHNVAMKVIDCEMEHDKNGACLYDKLRIYDGNSSSDPLIAEFCCADSANLPTFSATGNTSYLIFTSDATNEFKGFKIQACSNGTTTTTSTTTTSTTSTSSTSSTSSTTSITTRTTTAAPTTAPPTTKAATTAAPATKKPDDDLPIGGIVGGAFAGLLLLILLVVLLIYCCICKKKERPKSGFSSSKSFMKSMFFSRSSTVLDLHQNGEILVMPATVQTNIFDLDLPNASHKGNLLPPLHQPIGPTEGNIRNGPAMTRMVSDLKEPDMKVETPIPNVVWDINHPDISKPAFYSEPQPSDLKKPD